MTLLTFDEYKKVLDAGILLGEACCCMGRNKPEDPYCGCDMQILESIIPDDRQKVMDMWKENGHLPYHEIEIKIAPKDTLDALKERRMEYLKNKSKA